MSGDIKTLRARIKSVDSTMHLTRAMGLVASSKIRRANEKMANSVEYASAFDGVMHALSGAQECLSSPYFANRGEHTRLIVIAGDRGLAGGYNANVLKLAREYPDAEIIAIGKRACERYGKPFTSSEHFDFSDAMALSERLCEDYLNGEYDRLAIAATHYVSIMSQEAYVRFLLPFEKGGAKAVSMIFEPDELSILNRTATQYVAANLYAAVCESFASEVAARRMAMDNADRNAKVMIADLQLAYNRARQSAITQEITEIVAGSDA